ncbi:Mps1 binder-like protein [Cavenderia fasciculata]|uniref:Mps1 binder-like protein n=1 Tax=Cavenderia fasciculata TaxID=261658 RepID=F4PUB1_CACFS|nr:Mps1 binder-like protein [Cavenderia fasciculata]EGG21826.1 Mps1 binder-like protein [Cavenderia fasciculata]|eukprot:XP_004359676.1 Mps1 binder-like protein [Cavenderia fasciculata]
MFKIFASKAHTFKPKKAIKKGTKQYELHAKIKETLGSGDLTDAIKLPPNETLHEWLAVNSAGPQYEFLWADGKDIKKPVRVSAPVYVDYLMTWVQNTLEDEEIFPLNPTTEMSKNFLPTVKTIFKRLFRVYAHIYYSHMDRVGPLGVEAHLNTCFRNLTWLTKRKWHHCNTSSTKSMPERIKIKGVIDTYYYCPPLFIHRLFI